MQFYYGHFHAHFSCEQFFARNGKFDTVNRFYISNCRCIRSYALSDLDKCTE